MSRMISYAQNGEDVVLWRALGSISAGRYVEVGANHPTYDSVTRAFYDQGWSGITIEPVPIFADLHRAERPRDQLVQVAISNSYSGEVTLHVVGDEGLSTIVDAVSDRHAKAGIEHTDFVVPTKRLDDVLTESGWAGQEIHFMLIDVEGAEREVLQSVDLRRWRPWVLVVEATAPTSTVTTHGEWEPDLLAQGYEYCLFDGISRFYVSVEKADLLRETLSYPACVWDDFQTLSELIATQEREEVLERAKQERQELLEQTTHWRTVALTRWADAVSQSAGLSHNAQQGAELAQVRTQLDAVQRTLSWRVTRPLRGVRRLMDRTHTR